MINLVTVCTDSYPMIYAEKLHKQFRRLSNLKVEHHCITDRPDELPKFVKPIYPFKKSTGWWNKLNLFSPEMPSGNILYMDIDIVILNNFDDEISSLLGREESICCVSDSVNWMGVKFSSSLMFFKSGMHTKIFDNFTKNEKNIINNKGGDQVWISTQLKTIFYIDDLFPNLKKNFKFQLAKRDGKKFTVPMNIDENIKLIDFGGRPKPHQLEKLPYIKKNWHLV